MSLYTYTDKHDEWLKKEQVPQRQYMTEKEDAKQVKDAEAHDGSSRTQPSIREESWRATERGARLQPSGQGEGWEALTREEDVETQQRTLEVIERIPTPRRQRRFPEDWT